MRRRASSQPASAFPDHHGYTRPILIAWLAQARAAGAAALVTTEKDAVRLERSARIPSRLPVQNRALRIEIEDEPAAIDWLLAGCPAPSWLKPTRTPVRKSESCTAQSKFRLLVVRLGAMGDILHALPAVTALRRPIPRGSSTGSSSRVAGAAGGTGAMAVATPSQLSAAQPLVDRIHLAPAKEWGSRPLVPPNMLRNRHIASRPRGGRLRRVHRFSGRRPFGDARPRLPAAVASSARPSPVRRAARWLFSERVATRGAHVIEQDIRTRRGHGRRRVSSPSSPGCRWTSAPKHGPTESPAPIPGQPVGAHQSRRRLGRQALAARTLCCRR